MSRTETISPPLQKTDSGFDPSLFQHQIPQRERIFNPFSAPAETVMRATEVNLLLGQLALEGTATGMQLANFRKMGQSPDKSVRKIITGEHLSRDYPKNVVVAN